MPLARSGGKGASSSRSRQRRKGVVGCWEGGVVGCWLLVVGWEVVNGSCLMVDGWEVVNGSWLMVDGWGAGVS